MWYLIDKRRALDQTIEEYQAMTITIIYQTHTQSLIAYWLPNGRLFQTVSYNIKRAVAQILNVAYYQEC